jgi:hypothetical protein
MESGDLQDSSERPLTEANNNDQQTSEWVRLCDDFANLEGQYALLCELLTCLSRRENPLEPAGKHGIDMLVSQLKEHTATFKQQLYNLRPD